MKTAMEHTIELFIFNGSWHAKHSDHKVFELFNTFTLPTAFTATASAEEVLKRMKQLNPDCIVVLKKELKS
jgi:CBS domain-containing protein